MSWSSAQKFCQGENSALASISNSAINSFLTTLTKKTSWIGGYRNGSTWRWIDGSSWGYTNWSKGNPNNAGGVQDKTTFNWGGVGKWDDNGETKKIPFICRFGASTTTSTTPSTTTRTTTTTASTALPITNKGNKKQTQGQF